MDDDEVRQKRRETFAELLGRRWRGSINHAHLEVGVSREALKKLAAGQPCELPQLERFARASGEDVNGLRELYGYEPVINGARWFLDEVERIRQETGIDFQVSAEELGLARETPEALRAYADALRARVAARKRA